MAIATASALFDRNLLIVRKQAHSIRRRDKPKPERQAERVFIFPKNTQVFLKFFDLVLFTHQYIFFISLDILICCADLADRRSGETVLTNSLFIDSYGAISMNQGWKKKALTKQGTRLSLFFSLILLSSITSQPAHSQNQDEAAPDQPGEQQELMDIERDRLQVEKEKLEVEKQKLRIERARLAEEKATLALQEERIGHSVWWGIAGYVGNGTAIAGLFATIAGGLVVFWNYKLAQDGQITERFTEAINQLGTTGKDKVAIRLGGIYALERIAKDSKTDHWTIMEVLSEFIRAESDLKGSDERPADKTQEEHPKIRRDIQAALTVIERRKGRKEPEELNLSQADLSGADMRNARLIGANLVSSRLDRANLSGAKLIGANLDTASLFQADIRGTDFTDTNLKGANLRGAKRDSETKLDPPWDFVYQLVNVVENGVSEKRWEEKIPPSLNLKGKNLSGANLSGIYLHENDLRGEDFSKVDFSHSLLEYISVSGTDFSEASFREATIRYFGEDEENGTIFREADFSGSTIENVNFGGDDLTKAKFCNATIRGGDFRNSKLEETDFCGADLSEANLYGVDFEKIITDDKTILSEEWKLVSRLQKIDKWGKGNKFAREDLRGQELVGAYLRRVSLSGADLSNAILRWADLRKASLNDANFSNADLRRSNLRNANLRDANLSGADLSGADLDNAKLQRVDFRGTVLDDETNLDDNQRLIHKLVNEGGVGQDLRNTCLAHADLRGVNLRNADLGGAWLRGTIIDENTILDNKWKLVHHLVNDHAVNKDLSEIDLSRADLSKVDFSEATLKKAELSYANLTRAKFLNTDLKDANLLNANFTRATFWASGLKGDELLQAKEKAKHMIQSAQNWEKAQYSTEISELLGLPVE